MTKINRFSGEWQKEDKGDQFECTYRFTIDKSKFPSSLPSMAIQHFIECVNGIILTQEHE